MRAVALLRGVNLGAVRVAMAPLAADLESHGLSGVRTVLASGNVVLTAESDEPRTIAAAVADGVRRTAGHSISVIVVSGPVVRIAVDEYPFPRAADRHAYVVFAETRAALAQLVESAGPLDPAVEQVAPGEDVVYWDAPKGATLRTAFGKQYGRTQPSGVVTTRNLRTLEKILAVL